MISLMIKNKSSSPVLKWKLRGVMGTKKEKINDRGETILSSRLTAGGDKIKYY